MDLFKTPFFNQIQLSYLLKYMQHCLLLHFCSNGTLCLLSSRGAPCRYRLLNKFELAISFAAG